MGVDRKGHLGRPCSIIDVMAALLDKLTLWLRLHRNRRGSAIRSSSINQQLLRFLSNFFFVLKRQSMLNVAERFGTDLAAKLAADLLDA